MLVSYQGKHKSVKHGERMTDFNISSLIFIKGSYFKLRAQPFLSAEIMSVGYVPGAQFSLEDRQESQEIIWMNSHPEQAVSSAFPITLPGNINKKTHC